MSLAIHSTDAREIPFPLAAKYGSVHGQNFNKFSAGFMRLYVFDCIIEGHHLRGFMSQIDGPLTSESVVVGNIANPIEPNDWVFDSVKILRSSDGLLAQKVGNQVRRRGYSITSMEKPPSRFHVTELTLDCGLARVYSIEKDIDNFKSGLKRLQLSKNGELYYIKSESYLGEVEIASQKHADQLGLKSYHQLVKRGGEITMVSVADPISQFENKALRELGKKFKPMGISISDVKMLEMRRSDTGEDILPELRNPSQKYASIFLSHTSIDKPFARKLRDSLMQRGVDKVWFDEAEIKIGDSLIEKIQTALDMNKYFAIVLSPNSLTSNWVRKELEFAMHREINSGNVSIVPILYQDCDIPPFLVGKLYADFRDSAAYDDSVNKILERLALPSWQVRSRTS